ncbi:MAG: hypothetical protein LC664_16075 [Flavobacteriales bacterium]|nr:hypothetical protein [Flavobacteriales bacterium]
MPAHKIIFIASLCAALLGSFSIDVVADHTPDFIEMSGLQFEADTDIGEDHSGCDDDVSPHSGRLISHSSKGSHQIPSTPFAENEPSSILTLSAT